MRKKEIAGAKAENLSPDAVKESLNAFRTGSVLALQYPSKQPMPGPRATSANFIGSRSRANRFSAGSRTTTQDLLLPNVRLDRTENNDRQNSLAHTLQLPSCNEENENQTFNQIAYSPPMTGGKKPELEARYGWWEDVSGVSRAAVSEKSVGLFSARPHMSAARPEATRGTPLFPAPWSSTAP